MTIAMYTATSLTDLKAAATSNISVVYAGSLWTWITGNFTGQADNTTVVKSDSTALSVGAWVRQRASGIIVRQSNVGGISRDVETKLREVEKSITDYGTGTDWGVLVAAATALLGSIDPIRLITPPGTWTTGVRDFSAYRNLTFVFRPGARINQGANAVVLPERVEMSLGTSFTGTGPVTTKNKDETPLAEAPGGYVRRGNVGRGLRALVSNVGGHNNFAFGVDALAKAQHARSAIAIGNGAQQNLIGDATGARAMVSPGEVLSYFASGDAGVAIGDFTLRDNLSGTECIAIGANSLQQQTGGHCNVAVGANSQITGTDTGYNCSLGGYCLVANQSKNNIAIGWAALEGQTSGSNIAIGHAAMNGNKTGTRNVGIGPLVMQLGQTGTDNVAIGQEAAKNMTPAVQCTIVGSYAGGSGSGAVTNLTAIGFMAGLTVNGTGVSNTAIGVNALSGVTSEINCFGVGAGATVTGSNQGQLGNSNVTTYAYGAIQNRSDARDKDDVRDTLLGLPFILALRPVDFRWDRRDEYRTDPPLPPTITRPNVPLPREGSPTYEKDVRAFKETMAPYEAAMAAHRGEALAWAENAKLSKIKKDGSKKRNRFHHGLIAQEVRDVIKATGVDFGGYQDHSVNGGDDVLSLGYEELIAPLIKSVQQLAARISALEGAS